MKLEHVWVQDAAKHRLLRLYRCVETQAVKEEVKLVFAFGLVTESECVWEEVTLCIVNELIN
jgi:hypothetical protein